MKIHALRRRQLSHGFSQTSINQLQPLIDEKIKIFTEKLRHYAKTGAIFDLKRTISLYVLDILGEVAFSHTFGAQYMSDAEELSAINDHILLACVIGELPLQSITKLIAKWSPIPWMRRLLQSRNRLKVICSNCVKTKLTHRSDRRDLLQSLVEARDPETGVQLSEQEVNSEAFAML